MGIMQGHIVWLQVGGFHAAEFLAQRRWPERGMGLPICCHKNSIDMIVYSQS